MGTERSLKALLSGRVDALADDADAICRNKAGAGAQRRDVFFLGQAECALGDTRADLADIVGIGAAAAAENGEAEVEILVVGLGKFSGGDVIRQGFGGGVRQTGVCLDDHRNGTAGAHALRNRQDLLRTERAVDADGTRAQTFEGDGGGLRRDAEERAAGGLKCQRRKHRQVALLACGEHGGLDFEQIGHGLDVDRVHTCRRAAPDLTGEDVVGVVKGQRTGRGEQLADRSDVQSDKLCAGGTGIGNRGRDDLLHRVTRTGELVFIGAEGAGDDHVRAGLDILPVDIGDERRIGQIE